MWVASVLDKDGAIQAQIFLKGPFCKIGRREENCISFPSDQSISRNHAEINVKESKAFITDLESKFQTFFLNTEMKSMAIEAKTKIEIKSGQVVVFGRQSSTVRFDFKNVHVCATRLTKIEKDKLKQGISILGGKILQLPDNATHIVTNSISGATTKLLSAIVFKKSIVTSAWLDFAHTTKPSITIPPEISFFPPVEETSARLIDHLASRSTLFKGLFILSSNIADMQYSNLIEGCGGIFFAAHERSKDEINFVLGNIPNKDSTTLCLFIDEFNKRDGNNSLMQHHRAGMVCLSATQLASAIFSNVLPVLTDDQPGVRGNFSQRAFSQKNTVNTQNTQGVQSQILNLKKNIPSSPIFSANTPSTIIPKTENPLSNQTNQRNASNTANTTKMHSPQNFAVSKNIFGTPGAKIFSPEKLVLDKIIEIEDEVEDEVEKEADVDLSSPSPKSNKLNDSKQLQLSNADVSNNINEKNNDSDRKDVNKSNSLQDEMNVQKVQSIDSHDLSNTFASSLSSNKNIDADSVGEEKDDENRGKRKRIEQSIVNDGINSKISSSQKSKSASSSSSSSSSSSAPSSSVRKNIPNNQGGDERDDNRNTCTMSQGNTTNENENNRDFDTNNNDDNDGNDDLFYVNKDRNKRDSQHYDDEDDNDDWFLAVKGSDRQDLLKDKRRNFKSEYGSAYVDPDSDLQIVAVRVEAEVVLKMMMAKKNRNGPGNRSRDEPRVPGSSNIRDVRCFRKNSIRIVDDENVMSARYMESVLPKESEREIQLRLDAEADERREDDAEQMFSDRFSAAARGKVPLVRRR